MRQRRSEASWHSRGRALGLARQWTSPAWPEYAGLREQQQPCADVAGPLRATPSPLPQDPTAPHAPSLPNSTIPPPACTSSDRGPSALLGEALLSAPVAAVTLLVARVFAVRAAPVRPGMASTPAQAAIRRCGCPLHSGL